MCGAPAVRCALYAVWSNPCVCGAVHAVAQWDVKSRDYFLNLSGSWEFYGAPNPFDV